MPKSKRQASVAPPVAYQGIAPRLGDARLAPVVGFGLKDAVTPPGRPDTARATLPVKFPTGVTVTVDEPEPPWPIDK
jgi:hypothetical protein